MGFTNFIYSYRKAKERADKTEVWKVVIPKDEKGKIDVLK